jgi:enoyl-CoA hydratase
VGMRRAMEMMLTGDHMSGLEAVECGFANRAFAEADLEENVLAYAERVAMTPTDLQQINKRAVHRQMDAMGIRAGIRAGTEMQQLATFTATTQAHLKDMRKGLTQALSKRDEAFGDYRTSGGDQKSSD